MTGSMAWQKWERRVGEVFQNIGFIRRPDETNPTELIEGSFCYEKLNREMQVDVFVCVDRKTWILIECRARRNPSIKKWLREVAGRCIERRAKLKKELKRRCKVYGVAATSLKNLDSGTQSAASRVSVALWHHGVVDYLRTISKGARSEVKNLVLFRAGILKQEYAPIKLQVQRWPDIEEPWFVGFVAPMQVAHAAFVYQRGQGFGETAYQRFLRPQRIAEISKFVRANKLFPNSIVMALPPGTKIPKNIMGNALVTLKIPGEPEGIKIIDGQHRFFGALAAGRNPKLLCTLLKADDLDQAIIFATVNGKQVNVKKGELVSLFGIPGFAAKIASGVSEKDRDRIELEETTYRVLEILNKKEPLAKRLNFFPGRPAESTVPFKFLYDTVLKLAQNEYSGFAKLRGSPQEKAKRFGDKLAAFLSVWKELLGKSFGDPKVWFQPTMLSALIRTLPDLRAQKAGKEADEWLKTKKKAWKPWRPRPSGYRGAAGANKLAKKICKRVGIKPKFV